MKSNELRIGNLIYNRNYNSNLIEKVLGLDDIGINPQLEYEGVHASIGYDVLISNCEPIPLTEDWLLKFGFDNEDRGTGFKAIYNTLNILSTTFFLRPCYLGGYYWGFDNEEKECEINDNIELKHVHQLQNLYFALTGEELKITTPQK